MSSVSQVHSLSSCLEMEGYDQLPFTVSQLESFYHQVTQRLKQEKETVSQLSVRNALCSLSFCQYLCVIFHR